MGDGLRGSRLGSPLTLCLCVLLSHSCCLFSMLLRPIWAVLGRNWPSWPRHPKTGQGQPEIMNKRLILLPNRCQLDPVHWDMEAQRQMEQSGPPEDLLGALHCPFGALLCWNPGVGWISGYMAQIAIAREVFPHWTPHSPNLGRFHPSERPKWALLPPDWDALCLG